MRTTMMNALGVAAVAAALLLPTPRAQALTPGSASGMAAAAGQIDSVEKARMVYVCRNYWNGYRWVRRCRYVAVYEGPYYGPTGPYYYRGYRRW